MNDKLVNKFISEGKFSKLASCFKPFRPKYRYRDITYPFDQIINAHVNYTKNKDFLNSLEVLKTAYVLFDHPNREHTYVLYKYIIKNCLNQIETDEDIRSLIKIILEVYKNTKYHVLTNILLSLYFKIKNYELAYNFLLITSNNRIRNKDYYVYNLYRSLLFLYKEDLESASECINIAYKSRKIRKDTYFIFTIINLINNKYIKTDTSNIKDKFKDTSNLKDTVNKLKDTVRLGLYTHIYDVIEDMKDILIEYNIYSIVKTYLPQVCFANLIKRVFYLKNEDSKLSLDFLIEALDMEYEDIISMICSVIESNLIKGYISINKNMMVFSRRDPFPLSFY